MNVPSFRDPIAWQRAMDLTVKCNKVSRLFPGEERFALTSQLHRAAVSVPANIAEGKGRGFNRAYVNHLSIANGSVCELDTHLEVALRLNYVKPAGLEPIHQQIDDVGRLSTALRKSVESTIR